MDVETVASTMKVVLFWAIGILIPIIGLQAEEVIDDMVILEGTSIKNFFIFDLCLKNTVCLNFPLFSFFSDAFLLPSSGQNSGLKTDINYLLPLEQIVIALCLARFSTSTLVDVQAKPNWTAA